MKRMKMALSVALAIALLALLPVAATAAWPDDYDDVAALTIGMRGIVSIENAEGETLVFDSADESISGTIEVFDTIFLDSIAGSNSPSTMTFFVPASESFVFTSSVPEIRASVSDKAYVHAESKAADRIVIRNYARSVEIIGGNNFDYRLFMYDRYKILYDTVNVTGVARGSASLALNVDGSVQLSGVAAGARLRVNSNSPYTIPSGYDQVLITGDAEDIKGYDADGNQIKLKKIPIIASNPRWYSNLPAWIQWILRYVCFGWIWMV